MSIGRRGVLKAGVATSLAAARIPFVHTGVQDTIQVGLIGCGGRGTGAAQNSLESAPNIKLIALADLFPDRLDKCRTSLKKLAHPGYEVNDANCFTGLDAYRRVLDSPVDIVLLTQPPGFRPHHFEAAIDAGKHVFFEKPVAVDSWGVRKVIEIGEKAREKKLAVVPGTQSRHSPKIRETVKRVHDGAIGRIVEGRIYFNTGWLWHHGREEGWKDDWHYQVRNWYYFDWLSGDHIVEQHVHQHDMANWVMQANPVRAMGVGGRQQRVEEKWGNIYDHFAIDYEYPGGVHVHSMCRQWLKCDGKTGCEFIGTKGTADIMKGIITGENAWRWEAKEVQAQVQEHTDLVESIRKKEPLNMARRIAESSMVSILGREAAYTGAVIKWDDIMKANHRLGPDDWTKPTDYKPLPVPVPGGKPRWA
jgi:predicted dehydrogenase